MSFCERCVADKNNCENCKRNPKYEIYLKLKDHFAEYIPVCPVGATNCVYDPAYIKCYSPDWYKDLYGDKTPEEVIATKGCGRIENGYCIDYDDEDK